MIHRVLISKGVISRVIEVEDDINQAIKKGDKYFLGKLCKRSHRVVLDGGNSETLSMSLRFVHSGACLKCNNINQSDFKRKTSGINEEKHIKLKRKLEDLQLESEIKEVWD